jgi:Fe-S cluster biosynthesis and repair protein YggX
MAAVPWSDLGAGGLVVLAVLLLLTGRIVTRAVYEDMVRQRDKWETAWQASQRALAERDALIDANTEAMRTLEQSFNAFLSLRDRGRS